jgi:hypothetical protein
MENDQQQQRRTAAKEFLQSLNQLEDILQVTENQDEQEMSNLNNASADNENSSAIDLAAFEEAAADIEQYFEQASKKC